MSKGKMVIKAQFPEIISELIIKAKSDELRHFNLSSFFSEKSLEDVVKDIDRSMRFFSVYVFMEPIADDLWENSRYVEKEERQLCSRVDEEVRRYWWDRNAEHLKRIDERLKELKIDPEYKDMRESDLRDKIIEELDREIYPQMIERVKAEYQEIYEDGWEEYWKKEDPFQERIEYEYHRRYEMPPPFNHWDRRNLWQQYYFAKNRDGFFYYEQGGFGSSGQRYNHGFYGHLFALLNNETPIPTYFFTYDGRNRFVFEREEKGLHLHFFDLVGNFKINREESRRVLENVKKIEEARFI
ncbi:MAG: hypothetical protein PVH42_14395 [Desulfobacterales bacterium]|jgi:hypothetical protein